MSNNNNNLNNNNKNNDVLNEGKENKFLDVDRMVNEGLGGGNVTKDNGLVEDSTVDTMANDKDEDDDLVDDFNEDCDDCDDIE